MQTSTMIIEGHDHFLAKPMFEVFCITIHPKHIEEAEHLHDEDTCAIRGIARVLDEDGTTYDLYNRNSNNLEIVPFGGFLSITSFGIVPLKALKFVIMLYDTTRDIEIANGVFDLDYYSEAYEYDRVHVQKVEGKHGYACVYHSTFQYAITACVELIELHKKVNVSDRNNALFGTVVARLKRMYVVENEYPSTILFNNRQYANELEYGLAHFHTPIKLFRKCVVVPIDCSLVIEADFCDYTGTKITMDIQLEPSPCGFGKDIVSSRNCEMRVEVYWHHGYGLLPRETKVIDKADFGEESKSQGSCDAEQLSALCDLLTRVGIEVKNPKVSQTKMCFPPSSLKAQQPPSSISRRQPRAAIPILSSCVEIFSILICADVKEDNIYGKIEIRDSACCPFYIFDGSEKLDDRKTLPITGPSPSFSDDSFTMHLDLKDGKGSNISNGFLRWNCNNNDTISLYDRHVCSIIRGDIGYAVVHYSMITYGAQIGINVRFISQIFPYAFVKVYGRITAHYKKYRYQIPYDKQYYKSTLFSKCLEEYVEVKLCGDVKLPLMKSVVSVPLDDSLILDVNLKVSKPFTVHSKKIGSVDVDGDIHALAEFNADVNRYVDIHEEDYTVSISAEVSDIRSAA